MTFGLLLVVVGAGCGVDDGLGTGDEPVTFIVDGDQATMTGVLDTSTPEVVEDLLDDYPELEVIVMTDVPGSVDDDANLEAARLIAEAGIDTHVPADGVIASGGVDFFLAGEVRTYEPGAEFGVHSWAAEDGTTGSDLPQTDPEHDPYLDYFDEIGIDDDFYWFTLDAAPAESIHVMTERELERFDVGTEVDVLE
jgi:hypothetical protein